MAIGDQRGWSRWSGFGVGPVAPCWTLHVLVTWWRGVERRPGVPPLPRAQVCRISGLPGRLPARAILARWGRENFVPLPRLMVGVRVELRGQHVSCGWHHCGCHLRRCSCPCRVSHWMAVGGAGEEFDAVTL